MRGADEQEPSPAADIQDHFIAAPWDQLNDVVPDLELADFAVPDHAAGGKQEVASSGNQPDPPNGVRMADEIGSQRTAKAHSAEKD